MVCDTAMRKEGPMPKTLQPGAAYAGRRADVVAKVYSLEREADQLLQQYAGAKMHGRLLSRLIYEHHARQQAKLAERQRLQERVHTALGSAGADSGTPRGE